MDGSAVRIWGRVRPASASTPVEVGYIDRGGGGVAGYLRTDSAGYFTLDAYGAEGRRWWLSWGSHRGPAVRGYSYP